MTHVLVVDDSAVMRQFMTGLLSSEPDLTVTTAADPLIALSKMERGRPDVILLDLEMPRMSGLDFLRKVMAEDPIPVVVCSSHTGRGTEAAVAALDEGAVEVLAKPQVGLRDFLHESALMLVDTLRAAAAAAPRLPRPTRPRCLTPPRWPAVWLSGGESPVIAVAASTGGPEALRYLLAELPAACPGLVIVQHMPRAFTGPFAARLDGSVALAVKEAADGDEVVPGRALIAPGDRHLTVERQRGRLYARLGEGPLVSRHRPSADVLFESVAQVVGAAAIGVILTGMGRDGAAGLLAMRRAGGRTLAQDEATSVVFGMPREAIACGAAEAVAPLERVPRWVLERATELQLKPALERKVLV